MGREKRRIAKMHTHSANQRRQRESHAEIERPKRLHERNNYRERILEGFWRITALMVRWPDVRPSGSSQWPTLQMPGVSASHGLVDHSRHGSRDSRSAYRPFEGNKEVTHAVGEAISSRTSRYVQLLSLLRLLSSQLASVTTYRGYDWSD